MGLGVLTYPVAIDTDASIGATSGIVPGATPLAAVGIGQGDQLGIHKNLINAIIALQFKAGVNSSMISSSVDFRTRKFPFKTWLAAQDGSPTAVGGAAVVTRNARTFLAFPAGATTSTLLFGTAPLTSVLSAGVIVRLVWIAASATAGTVFWSVSIEALRTDQDTDSFDTAVPANTTAPATNGVPVTTAVTMTTIDALVPGETFCLRVQRLPTAGMLGDAQLQLVTIESF